MIVEELLLEGNKFVHKDTSKLILATLLEMNYLELTLHLQDKVTDEIQEKFFKCLKSIQEGKPIQYALNNVSFYGIDFYVDDRVLIPRFETEELVYNTNKYIDKYFNSNAKVLDLCTGSGCIGLTLKKLNNNLNVTLSDISSKALEVATYNKDNLKLDVRIIESDLFQNINSKFDILVSNPPYVSINDEVDKIVLENEPHLALFANDNGMEYYDKILSKCEQFLNDKYLIAFEIGDKEKARLIDLINKYLKDIKIITKQDMANRDRMVFIFKNINIDE